MGNATRKVRRRLPPKIKAPATMAIDTGQRQALLSQVKELREELRAAFQYRTEHQASFRQAEAWREHYVNLFDFAPVGCANFSRLGSVLDINLFGAELLGKERTSLVGKPLLPLFAPKDRRKWLHHLVAIRRQDRATVELHVPRASGELSVLQFFSLRMPHNSPSGAAEFRTAIIDVTAQRAAEDAMREARRVAETANRAKDRFLAVLSHELRTPLTPVLTTLTMMEKDRRFPEAFREHADMIRRNVELESRLIDDLLDVTRITRGNLELTRRPVVIGEVVHRALDVCEADFQAKRLQVVTKLGPAGESLVEADEARLQQVFWNLLKNAIKFTPAGGRIDVRCAKESEASVRVEIRDNGAGIEPACLKKIFEPFEQGGSDLTRRYGGLGLGLAICRGVVEKHGGKIAAQSAGEGKGATFSVTLPVCAGLPLWSAIQFDKAAAHGPRAPGNSLRILLVEDHPDTAKVMRQLLSLSGHTVETAMSVASALDAAAQPKQLDLLVSDLGLPDGSGLDLIRELRLRGCRIPGIALSGYGREDDVRRCLEAGFAVHLTKPADPDRLLKTIELVAASRGAAARPTHESC